MRTRRIIWSTAVVIATAMVGGLASGQPSGRAATMDDLLAEMKALRADLRESSVASQRLQVLVARSSLQEQRLRGLSQQLNESNASVDRVVEQRAEFQRRIPEIEDGLAGSGQFAQMPRAAAETLLAEIKRNLVTLQSQEQELRGRAGELADLVSSEQLRWAELNGKLDTLDLQLQSPSPPQRR